MPPRSEGFVRMPDAEFEAILTRCHRTHASVAKAQSHRPEQPQTTLSQAVERHAMSPVRVPGHVLDDISRDRS